MLSLVAYTENRRNFRSLNVLKLYRSHEDSNKLETAKLPSAGIGPKQCPWKSAAEKERLTNSVRKRENQRYWP